MESTQTFDNAYFTKIIEEASGVVNNPTAEMKEQETILKRADKNRVKKLMECEPKDYYSNLRSAIGSAMINSLNDTEFVTKCSAYIRNIEESLKTKPQFVIWSYKAIKFVCGIVLGIIKFSWDTLLITGFFTGRVMYHLVKNVGNALVATVYDVKDDAKYAGKEIASSFKTNILNK